MRLLLQQVSELLAGRPTRPRRSPYPPALFYSWRQWGVGAWCGMVGLFAVEVIALGALDLDLSVGFAAVGPAVTVAGVYALPFRDRPFAPMRAGRVIARGMGLSVGWILIGFMILGAMVLPLPGREVALIGMLTCMQLLLFSSAIWLGIRLAHRFLPEPAKAS